MKPSGELGMNATVFVLEASAQHSQVLERSRRFDALTKKERYEHFADRLTRAAIELKKLADWDYQLHRWAQRALYLFETCDDFAYSPEELAIVIVADTIGNAMDATALVRGDEFKAVLKIYESS